MSGADRIMQVMLVRENGTTAQVTEPHYVFWRTHSTVFESLTAYSGERYNLSSAATPRSVWGSRVTADFFATFGVDVALGPGFSGRDSGEVVLSHGLWRDSFAADETIVGTRITLDSSSFTVVGVAAAVPRQPPLYQELWTPLEIDPDSREFAAILQVAGRLRHGVGREEAQAEMAVVQERLLAAAGAAGGGAGVLIRPIQDFLYGSRRATLILLLVAGGFVLLLASANVANLQLSRAAKRTREIAIRRALGASVSQTLKPLVVETLLLATLGALAGIALAFAIVRWLWWSQPSIVVDAPGIGVDLRVVGFAVAVSLGASLLACVAPALESARVDPSRALGGRSSTGGTRRLRWSHPSLIVGEVAVTLWAVMMAILLLESYGNVSAVDPGFDAADVLTIELPLTRNDDGEPATLAGLSAVLLPRLRGLPGVASVSTTTSLPLESGDFLSYAMSGADEDEALALAQFRGVSPDFFRTMGIRIVRGRAFAESDGPNTAPVAIVGELAALRHWPGRDPIGERVTVFPGSRYGEAFTRTIVGVANDVHELGLAEREAWESLYVPINQIALPLAKPIFDGGVGLLVRSEAGSSPLVEAVRREIREYDRSQPVGEVRTMDDVVRRSAAPYRFRTTVVVGFAALALLLAAVGIYGWFRCWPKRGAASSRSGERWGPPASG